MVIEFIYDRAARKLRTKECPFSDLAVKEEKMNDMNCTSIMSRGVSDVMIGGQ